VEAEKDTTTNTKRFEEFGVVSSLLFALAVFPQSTL